LSLAFGRHRTAAVLLKPQAEPLERRGLRNVWFRPLSQVGSHFRSEQLAETASIEMVVRTYWP